MRPATVRHILAMERKRAVFPERTDEQLPDTDRMKYLETGSEDPFYNLAYEEYILFHKKEDYLILWQNRDTVVCGQNQNILEEIDWNYVEDNGISVVRRATGGGAVFHDLGNLNYSFVFHRNDSNQAEHYIELIVAALRKIGLNAEFSGRNDILANGRKVSGTAQRISGDRMLLHGTLLFDSDLELLGKVLHADTEKFRSKGVKSVRSRVENIRDILMQTGKELTLGHFWELVGRAVLEEENGNSVERLQPGKLTEEELVSIRKIRDEKYATEEWNRNNNPAFQYHDKKRFPNGSVEVYLDATRGNIIREIRFFGDFLSQKPLKEVETALEGCFLSAEEIGRRLEQINISEYFGEISPRELLAVILPESEKTI